MISAKPSFISQCAGTVTGLAIGAIVGPLAGLWYTLKTTELTPTSLLLFPLRLVFNIFGTSLLGLFIGPLRGRDQGFLKGFETIGMFFNSRNLPTETNDASILATKIIFGAIAGCISGVITGPFIGLAHAIRSTKASFLSIISLPLRIVFEPLRWTLYGFIKGITHAGSSGLTGGLSWPKRMWEVSGEKINPVETPVVTTDASITVSRIPVVAAPVASRATDFERNLSNARFLGREMGLFNRASAFDDTDSDVEEDLSHVPATNYGSRR